jgi:hypothetical protein
MTMAPQENLLVPKSGAHGNRYFNASAFSQVANDSSEDDHLTRICCTDFTLLFTRQRSNIFSEPATETSHQVMKMIPAVQLPLLFSIATHETLDECLMKMATPADMLPIPHAATP